MTVTRRDFIASLAAIPAIPHISDAFVPELTGDEPRYRGRTLKEWLQWLADDPSTRPYHQFNVSELANFGEPAIPHLLTIGDGDRDLEWQAACGIAHLLPHVMPILFPVFFKQDPGARSCIMVALSLWRKRTPTDGRGAEWDEAYRLLLELLKRSDCRQGQGHPGGPLLDDAEVVDVARCLIQHEVEVSYCLGMVAEMLYATDQRVASEAAELLAEHDVYHPLIVDILGRGIKSGEISPYQIKQSPLFVDEVLPTLVESALTEDVEEIVNILSAVAAVKEARYRDFVRSKIDHPMADIRRAAIGALRTVMSDEEAIGHLLRGLDDEDEDVAWRAAGYLWATPNPELVIDPLISLLTHDRAKLRKSTATSLACIGPDAQKAVPALQAMVESYADETGLAATVALSRITGNRPDTRLLLSAMSGTNNICACFAGMALANCGPDDVPALRWALSDARSAEVLGNTLFLLAKIGPAASPAIPEILSLFDHDEFYVRLAATHTAIAFGRTAVPELRRMATTGQRKSRPRARWALRQIEVEEKILAEGVRRSIEDADPEVKLAAIKSISSLGEATGVIWRLLEPALRDPDIAVRLAAIGALTRIAAPYDRWTSTLEIALGDSNLAVRMGARKLLQELRGKPA